MVDNLKRWWNEHSHRDFHFFNNPSKPPLCADQKNGSAFALLGPFEASETVLGEGGYAKVVLGRNKQTGARVAIKLLDTRQELNSGRAASSEAAIVREVAALRRAGQHPNVCQLLGYYRLDEDGAVHAMVMELCRGGELFRLVERYGAMDEERIRPIFNGVLAGVRHLHAQGIAHRDLKLENILLDIPAPGDAPGDSKPNGPSAAEVGATPKIVDLGLAHAHARGADGDGWAPRELTQFCGSRSYCAPEVMARLGYNGYVADVWSLGVCLFGLVSGFFPVDEASARDWRFERLARQQHATPHRSSTQLIFSFYQRPCPLSAGLVQLLDGMLQVAPAKRIGLEQISSSPWVRGLAPPPAPEPPLPTPPELPIEVDVSDLLERSAGGDGMSVDRSTGGGLSPAEAAAAHNVAPPLIRRQRAEESVGMVVE